MSDLKVPDLPEPAPLGGPSAATPPHAAPRMSVVDTAKTIAWSFLGIRKRVDHDQETPRINPIHIVVAGFVGVVLLVAGLIVLVNLVVRT